MQFLNKVHQLLALELAVKLDEGPSFGQELAKFSDRTHWQELHQI